MADHQADDPAPGDAAQSDVTHRRNYLAGLWAAELLGLFGRAAADYSHSIMHPGHPPDTVHGDDQDTVIGKLARDLEGHVNRAEIHEKMMHFLTEAKRQIKKRNTH